MHRPTSSFDALAGLDPELTEGDILHTDSLIAAMRGCALVFHVAAVSDYWRSSADRLYQVNVEGTRNVLRASFSAGIERLVFTSSIGALGFPRAGQLLDESSVFNVAPRRFAYGYS